jgi:peptidase M28-like protein
VNAREQIEALVAHAARGRGTDAERRAARDLARRLEGLGRDATVEPFEVWPAYPLAHLIHALLAIAGSVVSVYSPLVGTALVAAAVVLTFGDGSGLFMLTRRLTGRRASQNVVSPEEGGKPGTLVLVAHYDAGRPPRAFRVFFWSMVAVLVCCVARLPGLDGAVLTAVQFVPTVLLIVSVPLLVDLALAGAPPGANDNASGVATVLRLAERYGGALEHFDLCVLFTGSHEGFALGMRAFLKRHRKKLSKERTVFVNVDEVGAGTVRYSRREGLLLTAPSHVQLVEICDEIAEDDEGAFDAQPLVRRSPSNRYGGYPGITISCRPASERVEDEALERAFGFCCELVERLDASIGPDLERDGVSAEPVPSR